MSNARLRHAPAHAEAAIQRALDDLQRDQRGTASRTSRPRGTLEDVTQGGHGFSVGACVGPVGGVWTALTTGTYDGVAGVVVDVHSSSVFTVCLDGPAELPSAGLLDYTLYALSAGAGVPTPYLITEDVGAPIAVFLHLTLGRIVVLGPGVGRHQHPLTQLSDQGSDVYDETLYGINYLEMYVDAGGNIGTPADYRWRFSLPGLGADFGTGTAPTIMDGGGAQAGSTWRDTGGLWFSSVPVSQPLIPVPSPEPKLGIGFGPTSAPLPHPGDGYLWFDPDNPTTYTTTRPDRGVDAAPIGYVSGNRALFFPILAAVLFNRLRDLQDVEDLEGDPPEDGHVLAWSELDGVYKHQAIGTLSLDDNAVTDAKLRQGAALSVIGNATNLLANVADIAAATDHHVLRRSGTTLGFGQVATGGLADGAVTGVKLENSGVTAGSYGASGANVPSLTVDAKGRVTAVSDRALTAADVGAAPASHTHSLAGDVTGNTGASVVAQVQGRPWSSAAPATRDIPTWNGTSWTFSQVLTTAGDLFYRSATQTDRLPIGSTGQFLRVAGGLPAWQTVNLDDLADVSMASPTKFDVPYWDGISAYGKLNLDLFVRAATWVLKNTYTTSTGTHTFAAGSRWAMIEIIGAGGGGQGGSASTASGAFGGGGGGQGARVLWFVRINGMASVDYTVGTKGTGGAATGAAGTDGTASTIDFISGTIYAPAGLGGSSTDGGLGGQQADGLIVTSYGDYGMALVFPGESGQPGRITQVNYNGTGNITSIAAAGGLGGGRESTTAKGQGGNGGDAGAAGTDGVDGQIRVWEI